MEAVSVQRSRRERTIALILGAGTAALLIYLAYMHQAYGPDDPTPQQVACADLDKTCLSAKLLPEAMGKCSDAITRPLRYEFEWTNSFSTPRFESADWYVPGKSIIYIGRELKVSNAFGAKERMQYYCVVSTATGFVQKAGIPSLQ